VAGSRVAADAFATTEGFGTVISTAYEIVRLKNEKCRNELRRGRIG
jgi:hypothetical protein